jgi:hypothetical protein
MMPTMRKNIRPRASRPTTDARRCLWDGADAENLTGRGALRNADSVTEVWSRGSIPTYSFELGAVAIYAVEFSVMPWDEAYYPRSMRNLPLEVRLKAIEIANALLEEGYEEGKAIRIAIAKAKEWAENRE